MDFTFQNGIQTIKTWITNIFNMADYNKCCGGNNAEKLVLFDQNWFISYNRMLLLYDWVSVSYYTLEHLVSSLKKNGCCMVISLHPFFFSLEENGSQFCLTSSVLNNCVNIFLETSTLFYCYFHSSLYCYFCLNYQRNLDIKARSLHFSILAPQAPKLWATKMIPHHTSFL